MPEQEPSTYQLLTDVHAGALSHPSHGEDEVLTHARQYEEGPIEPVTSQQNGVVYDSSTIAA